MNMFSTAGQGELLLSLQTAAKRSIFAGTRALQLALWFVMCTMFLQADVQDHLKRAEGKSDLHQTENIDFIYMINLDQRPEKFAKSVEQLHPYGIYPYRFSAVNGWELSLEDINDVGVRFEPWMPTDLMGTTYFLDKEGAPHHEIMNVPGRMYFCHCLVQGSIGICLSHLSVLQDAYNAGYETIWVMEDDIEVIRNPRLVSTLVEELDQIVGKEGWDILFTDRDTKGQDGNYVICRSYARRPNFTPLYPELFALSPQVMEGTSFMRIWARYGAYSMIIRRSGMKKILDFFKEYQIFLPYDMDFYLPPAIQMFALREDVVSTLPRALSDNARPNYKKQD